MRKSINVINNVITLVVSVVLVFVSATVVNKTFGTSFGGMVLYFVVGAILSGLINAFIHEFGHLVAGKINNFAFISMTVWFFRWKKVGKKTEFSFCFIGEESGYTEMVSVTTDDLRKRYMRMTFGGILASLVMTLISVVPFVFSKNLPEQVFAVLSVFLPISAYYFLGNLLPMVQEGVKNDGAVYFGLKKNDISSQVMMSVASIHSELLSGKTPSEIDEKYYFDVPQLPEDDLNFIMLLNARYAYYLDKGDYENAVKVNDRLVSSDYVPKSMRAVFEADELYGYCVINKNSEKADELMYELDKYLNNCNNATNIRIKMAYLINILNEKDNLLVFYKKGLREIKKEQLKGVALFEKKLLDGLYFGSQEQDA